MLLYSRGALLSAVSLCVLLSGIDASAQSFGRNKVEYVDLRFTDPKGKWQHLSMVASTLDEDQLEEGLMFDGSSIRGFTEQKQSDLRLGVDWTAFYWAPADVFGTGKVLVFGDVIDKDGSPYSADIRGVLKGFADGLFENHGYTLNAANEIAVAAFLGRRIGFREIHRIIDKTMQQHANRRAREVGEVLEVDRWARERASSFIRVSQHHR